MPVLSRAPAPEIFESLENQLRTSLKPVAPNPAFVEHLHTRLAAPSAMVVERRHSTALSMLIVAGSMTVGLLMVFMLRRRRAALAG